MTDSRPTSSTASRRTLRGTLAVWLMRAIAWLPLRANHWLGAMIGHIAWFSGSSAKKVTLTNLQICYPHLAEQELKQLAHSTLVETGKSMTEIARIWFYPDYAVKHYLCEEEGAELLEACQQAGKPVVILAPHFGCWEILNYWLSTHFDLHVLFKLSRFPELDDVIRKAREHFRSTTYPTTPRGLAGLIRAIRKGATTAILPDQVPDTRGGLYTPFFGRPALTGTLSPKLIQQTGARAFFCWAQRLPKGQGYRIIIREAVDEGLYSDDIETATSALNHCIEALVNEDTCQYQWAYKRFKKQPDGFVKPY